MKARGVGLSTCMFQVCGGISISHGINVHKVLLEDGQQEGEAVVQTNIQDELSQSGNDCVSVARIPQDEQGFLCPSLPVISPVF